MEDNVWWKMTFGGRQPLVEDDLQWKTPFSGSLHAAFSALRHFNFFALLAEILAICTFDQSTCLTEITSKENLCLVKLAL